MGVAYRPTLAGMPMLPAICDDCGALFSSGFRVENSTGVRFSNMATGPCPRCGGYGQVPDGTYDVIGDTISVLASSVTSASRVQAIIDTLERARHQQMTGEELAATVRREAPEVQGFLDLLGSAKAMGVMSLLSLLITVLTLVLTQIEREGIDETAVRGIVQQAVQSSLVYSTGQPQQTSHAQKQVDPGHEKRAGQHREDRRRKQAAAAKRARKRNR